jgi:hypothetical protein
LLVAVAAVVDRPVRVAVVQVDLELAQDLP